MNPEKQKFDAAMVADRARQIAEQEKEVESLREVARQASSAVTKAECRLSNLRTEFTRIVSSQLDPHTVQQHVRFPKSVPV